MGMIPVIDLLSLPAENQKLRAACEEVGCFRVINHGVPPELLTEMKEAVESIFSIPDDINLRYTEAEAADKARSRAHAELNPLMQVFRIYTAARPAYLDSFCSEYLPHAPPQHKEAIKNCGSALHRLTVDVAGKIAESMGLEGYSFAEWSGAFRSNKYNFTDQSVGSHGIFMHTDGAMLAVLQEDVSVGGLQVMDRRSGTVEAVDPLPGSLLVILGDIAKAWSNGRLHNVVHGVTCKEGSPRVSFSFLILAPMDHRVEPPAAFVDSDHPRLYQTFDYDDYQKLVISTRSFSGALPLLPVDDQAPKNSTV